MEGILSRPQCVKLVAKDVMLSGCYDMLKLLQAKYDVSLTSILHCNSNEMLRSTYNLYSNCRMLRRVAQSTFCTLQHFEHILAHCLASCQFLFVFM